MQDYDVVLKVLLQKSLRRLTGKTIVRWLATELPKVQNLRIDLLCETADGELMQIEVQSTNDSGMPFRMLEYLVAVARIHGRIPKQILLYVGRKPLQMASQFEWADGIARFTLIDMCEFDAEPLIASPETSDNVIGILGRLKDQRTALHSVLAKLSDMPRDEAAFYFQALLLVVGLRGLRTVFQEEVKKMSLTIDLSENEILGPAYQRGRQEGKVELLRQLVERKFGPLPSWAEQNLSQRSAQELEQVGTRVFDAPTLEDLLR